MENDLDIKLYNEYLNGEKEAFELLYNKYKDKITLSKIRRYSAGCVYICITK